MSEKPRSTIAPLAAGASVVGICCGLPLLASAGVLGAIAGIGFGSGLVVAIAAAVAVVGFVRWRRTGDTCHSPGPDDAPSPSLSDTAMSPTHRYRNDEEAR